jgi:methyl-accepting chemotaxis protein
MGEITAASQEQTQGIEQINQAITQMDQVTQQNAALVEEAAAAASSLQEQAGSLSQVVSVFTLESNAGTALRRPNLSAKAPVAPRAAAAKAAPRKREPTAAREVAAAAPGDWESF